MMMGWWGEEWLGGAGAVDDVASDFGALDSFLLDAFPALRADAFCSFFVGGGVDAPGSSSQGGRMEEWNVSR